MVRKLFSLVKLSALQDVSKFPPELREDIEYVLEAGSGEFVSFPMNRGFIFDDGSVLELSFGEDHRVISSDSWEEFGIVAYTSGQSDVAIRVNGYLTYSQCEVLKEWLETYGFSEIYIDVYEGGRLAESKAFYDYYEAIEFLCRLSGTV